MTKAQAGLRARLRPWAVRWDKLLSRVTFVLTPLVLLALFVALVSVLKPAPGAGDPTPSRTPVASATFTETVTPRAGSYFLPVIQQTPGGWVLATDGRRHRFSDFTTGKITLLSFMYTYCADPVGCPLVYRTFNTLRDRALATPGMAPQLRLVSLSFDPTHDTVQAMASYASGVGGPGSDLRWDFLTTASIADLQPILDGLGQSAELQRSASGAPARFYNHLVKVFLVDKQGRVREIYSTAFLQPELMFNDLQTLLIESQRRAMHGTPKWNNGNGRQAAAD